MVMVANLMQNRSAKDQMPPEEGKSTEARGSLPAGDGGPAGGEPVAREMQDPARWAISSLLSKQQGCAGRGSQE
jgi:hypothetical protein